MLALYVIFTVAIIRIPLSPCPSIRRQRFGFVTCEKIYGEVITVLMFISCGLFLLYHDLIAMNSCVPYGTSLC